MGLLAVLLLLGACDRSSATGEISHPTRDNLPDDAELADLIRMDRTGEQRGELDGLAGQIATATEVLTLGMLEGPEHLVFGKVEDIDADPQGRLAVLDSRFNQVRVYDPEGAVREVFGGPGRGPNEFLAPEALARDRSGLFIVADRSNQLKVFERRDGAVEQKNTIRLDFVPEDFCVLGDRIYVQGGKLDRGTIHVFSASGEPLRSFGEMYRSETPMVSSQLSDGRIACSEEGQVVVTMFEHLPIVYAYSPDGQLQWRSRLADFQPMRIVEGKEPDGRPFIQYQTADLEFDIVESLTAMPDGMMMIQTTHHDPVSTAEHREYAELRTYLLSAQTGEGAYVGSHLPKIYDVESSRMFGGTNEPFPQVKVYDFHPAGRGE